MTRSINLQPEQSSVVSYEAFTGGINNSAIGSPKSIKIKHPTYSKMIDEAIAKKSIDRKGISLQFIKKYLKEKYSIEIQNMAVRRRICKYLKNSVGEGGHLKKLSGIGANGSYALRTEQKPKKVKKESGNELRLIPVGNKRKLLNPAEASTFAKVPPKVTKRKTKQKS